MRRLLLSLTLALTLSAVGASPALAEAPQGAQKAPLFGPFSQGAINIPCATGAEPTPETFGFAVFNTPGDEATLTGEVALTHAAPNSTYRIELEQVESPFCIAGSQVGEITTNMQGRGNLHFTTARNPAANKFLVEVFNNAVLEFFASPSVELD